MTITPYTSSLYLHVQGGEQPGCYIVCNECGASMESYMHSTVLLASRAHDAGWRAYGPNDWVVGPCCGQDYIQRIMGATHS